MSKYITGADQGGSIAASGLQGVTIANDDTEQTLFALLIPAFTLRFGNVVEPWFIAEVLALLSGELRFRMWAGAVGGIGLVSGFLPKTSTGKDGFAFTKFGVVDTGAGLSAARLAGGAFGGVDLIVDLTQDLVINCTAQMTVANAGNSYRGLTGSISIQ
jgi:hypothetical protein